MNPINEEYAQPLPLNPNPSLDFSTILNWQHEVEANPSLLSGEGFGDLTIHGPVYVTQEQQDQAPSWGPSRSANRLKRNRIRKAERRYLNQNPHESSRTILIDRSTGIYPGNARIDANNHPGNGQVWISV